MLEEFLLYGLTVQLLPIAKEPFQNYIWMILNFRNAFCLLRWNSRWSFIVANGQRVCHTPSIFNFHESLWLSYWEEQSGRTHVQKGCVVLCAFALSFLDTWNFPLVMLGNVNSQQIMSNWFIMWLLLNLSQQKQFMIFDISYNFACWLCCLRGFWCICCERKVG